MKRTLAFALAVMLVSGAAAQSDLWLDVPYVRQSENACGPAALAMLMQYWKERAPEAAITESDADFERIRSEFSDVEATGVLASKLVSFLEVRRFRAFPIRGTWEDLRPQIEKGRPLIAAVRPDGSKFAHFVVVAGVEAEAVLINDPARRKLSRVPRADWEREWMAAQNWLLVAAPRLAQ